MVGSKRILLLLAIQQVAWSAMVDDEKPAHQRLTSMHGAVEETAFAQAADAKAGYSVTVATEGLKLSTANVTVTFTAPAGHNAKDMIGLYAKSKSVDISHALEWDPTNYVFAAPVGEVVSGAVHIPFSALRSKLVAQYLQVKYVMSSGEFAAASDTFEAENDVKSYSLTVPYADGHPPFGAQVGHVNCKKGMHVKFEAPKDRSAEDYIAVYNFDLCRGTMHGAHCLVAWTDTGKDFAASFPLRAFSKEEESAQLTKMACDKMYQLVYYAANTYTPKYMSEAFRTVSVEPYEVEAPMFFRKGPGSSDPLKVPYKCSPSAPFTTWAGIVPEGKCTNPVTCAASIVAWKYIDCGADYTGTAVFALDTKWPNEKLDKLVVWSKYEFVIFDSTFVAAGRDTFKVIPADLFSYLLWIDPYQRSVDTAKQFMLGENLRLMFRMPPTYNKGDWIGLYQTKECDPAPAGGLQFNPCVLARAEIGDADTCASDKAGYVDFKWDQGAASQVLKNKLDVGPKYIFRMHLVNSHTVVAQTAEFTAITAMPPSNVPFVPWVKLQVDGKPTKKDGAVTGDLVLWWVSPQPHTECDWIGLFEIDQCLGNNKLPTEFLPGEVDKCVIGAKKLIDSESTYGKMVWTAADLAPVDAAKQYHFRYFQTPATYVAYSDVVSFAPAGAAAVAANW